MTKEQAAGIPEELYNLTQLAEVTLAAGRLSTTNVSEIKDYINNSNRRTPASPVASHVPASVSVSVPAPDSEADPCPAMACAHLEPKSANFYSSSDDDSNYYSHKIFDRKKLRRSTISDNSRFDEHSSCSSLPCSSGDEQQFGLAGHLPSLGGSSDGGKMNASDSGGSTSSGGLLDDEHICPECGKKYSTSSNLARHRQTHRSIMDKKARRCPYCEKVYVSMPAFSMHVRTHNQGCECPYCGKCFSRPWLLQGHIRTHTGEKPFKCSVCNKAFADKSNLRAHIQTHSNTKPHSCARCGKSFALKSYLYKHEESSCMKNHPKPEKDAVRPSRAQASAHQTSPKSSSSPSAGSVERDSAKSTLASKLLQKRSHGSISSGYAMATDEQPLNLNNCAGLLAARDVDVIAVGPKSKSPAPVPAPPAEKSYTTVTNPMSQEDYERFARISVIRPPPQTPPTMAYQEQLPGAQPPMHFYSPSAGDTHGHGHGHGHDHNIGPQDAPVDFSPKNSFSHSSKTSPFELTGNYAIVA